MATEASLVILGSGAAALSAAEALQEQGFPGSVVLLSDVDQPYSPVLTSYYAGGKITREQCFVWGDGLPCGENLTYRKGEGSRVVSLRPQAQEVETADGTVYHFDACLVATGASPVPVQLEGVDPERFLYLRTMADADRLHQVLGSYADSGEGLLISGSSLVALKAAEAAVERGVPVTLLVRSQLMRTSTHPQVASLLQQFMEEKGVVFRLGTSLDSLEDLDSFGHILVAHGVHPNLDFLEEGSLELDTGILVDEHMRSSNSAVYAAGDVAQLRGGSIPGLWGVARYQGRCAGQAIAGLEATLSPAARISATTLPVCGAVLAFAGTVQEAEGRTIQVRDFGKGRMGAFAYETTETEGPAQQDQNVYGSLVLGEMGLTPPQGQRLVGFNLWDPDPQVDSPLLRASAFLHQSILGA